MQVEHKRHMKVAFLLRDREETLQMHLAAQAAEEKRQLAARKREEARLDFGKNLKEDVDRHNALREAQAEVWITNAGEIRLLSRS